MSPDSKAERRTVVELRGVSKSFGATIALSEVSLELRSGEVVALAGENGAGKSTLIRILSGVHGDYSGELLLAGNPVRFFGPQAAQRAGIATIHQELSLVGALSVADNLELGEPYSMLGWVPRRRGRERARQLLSRLRIDVDPEAKVETLPLATRQLVEIARAIGRSARLLILDEPTSALSEIEATSLIELVKQLKNAGTGVLYVSHRMEEIYQLADRILVLRDGKRVLMESAGDVPRSELLRAMLGRELSAPPARSSEPGNEPLLEVTGLSLRARGSGTSRLADISFDVRPGEVVGVTGLVGSGASELLYGLYGALPLDQGTRLRFSGKALGRLSPRRALRQKIAFCAADREQNLIFERSVVENITLSCLDRFSRFGFVQKQSEIEAAQRLTLKLPIHARSLLSTVKSLSGGNQQKTALLRACLIGPRLLLLDEPTRGIDVGARQEIYRLVRELTEDGVGVVWQSSELEELLELADRILVLSRGRLALSLDRAEASRERILAAAMGRSGAG